MNKPNLKEIYESGIDVRDSYIPNNWKDSFNEFILGQACYMTDDFNGGQEFCYYSCDFRKWYHQNKLAIERDIKIDKVIENDKG